MTLSVHPVYVDLYGTLVDRAADDAQAAREYLERHAEINTAEQSWLVVFGNLNQALKETIGNELVGLWEVCTRGGAALHAVARYYRDTDLGAAAMVDDAYTASPPINEADLPSVDDEGGQPVSFTDQQEPAGFLKSPGQPDEPHDALTVFEETFDWLDPGAWVMKAITLICGSNPVEESMARLGGDWVGFAQCAEALDHLGEFYAAVGLNLKVGNRDLRWWWTGRAADASCSYFDRLGTGVMEDAKPVHRAAEDYRTAARGAYSFARAGGPIAAAIIDAAIVAGIGIAAGTATSETGVGALLGYGAAGFEALEMVEKAERLFRLMSAADATVGALSGQLETIIGTCQESAFAALARHSVNGSNYPDLPGLQS